MLVISRIAGNRPLGGFTAGDVHIQILSIRGDKIRIGIDAHPDVVILRDELRPKTPDETRNDELTRRLAHGERLSDIEIDMDFRENQRRIARYDEDAEGRTP
jgi:carbon storage regulator CsrA